LNKKLIILLGLLGLIPFYFSFIINIFSPNFYFQNESLLNKISVLYGSLIVSFLCGMHWREIIFLNKTKLYIFPMFPVIIIWVTQFFLSLLIKQIVIVILLFWCLVVDLSFLSKNSPVWFKRLRLYLTIVATASFFPQFFS